MRHILIVVFVLPAIAFADSATILRRNTAAAGSIASNTAGMNMTSALITTSRGSAIGHLELLPFSDSPRTASVSSGGVLVESFQVTLHEAGDLSTSRLLTKGFLSSFVSPQRGASRNATLNAFIHGGFGNLLINGQAMGRFLHVSGSPDAPNGQPSSAQIDSDKGTVILPEPGTLTLFATGLTGILEALRRDAVSSRWRSGSD